MHISLKVNQFINILLNLKAMKKVLYIVGGVIALLLIASLLSPKEITAERSTIINAPKEVIFEQVRLLKNHDNWSPWRDKDLNMQTTLTGTDGTVGAKSSWVSEVKGVGIGSQTITSITENESVLTALEFEGQGKADGFIRLKDTTGGVKVSWGFHINIPPPFNLMLLFPGGDDGTKDFDAGLAKLKALCESMAAAPAIPLGASEIKEIQFLGKAYLGIRGKVGLDKVSEWYEPNIGKVMAAAKSKNAIITGNPGGLYFEWDDQKTMTTEMAAVVPIASKVAAGNDIQSIEIKPSRALQLDYRGGYYGSGAAHGAMDAFIKEKGLKQVAPVIEEYITGPANEPDSNKWVTRIIYLIAK